MSETPYKGKKKSRGMYNCKQCGRSWESANSWAHTGQKCEQCLKTALPHKQMKLKKDEPFRGDPDVPHRVDLCYKCKKLGRYCVGCVRD